MKLQDFQKSTLPDGPGCYFFHDGEGIILYIGKATSLRSRVRSYFDPDLIRTRGAKIVAMVENAARISFKETSSVLEALLLEAELIKKHQPYFNTKEKDDKSFYSVIVTKEDFPRVLLVRNRNIEKLFSSDDIASVYGPFTSGTSIKDALKLVRQIFPFRDTCEPNSGIPCFNAQLGLCPGVCMGKLSKTEYKKYIHKVDLFFTGKKTVLEKNLNKEMSSLAKELRFEEAGKIKKQLFALSHIRDTVLLKREDMEGREGESSRIESYDIAHISGTSRVGVMTVIENGAKETSEYRKFKLEEGKNDDVGGYREMLARRIAHTEWPMPTLVVVDGGLQQKNIAEAIFKGTSWGDIPVVSVVKDERHKAKAILGNKALVEKYKQSILLGNSEAHRYGIAYHKLLRQKKMR